MQVTLYCDVHPLKHPTLRDACGGIIKFWRYLPGPGKLWAVEMDIDPPLDASAIKAGEAIKAGDRCLLCEMVEGDDTQRETIEEIEILEIATGFAKVRGVHTSEQWVSTDYPRRFVKLPAVKGSKT